MSLTKLILALYLSPASAAPKTKQGGKPGGKQQNKNGQQQHNSGRSAQQYSSARSGGTGPDSSRADVSASDPWQDGSARDPWQESPQTGMEGGYAGSYAGTHDTGRGVQFDEEAGRQSGQAGTTDKQALATPIPNDRGGVNIQYHARNTNGNLIELTKIQVRGIR